MPGGFPSALRRYARAATLDRRTWGFIVAVCQSGHLITTLVNQKSFVPIIFPSHVPFPLPNLWLYKIGTFPPHLLSFDFSAWHISVSLQGFTGKGIGGLGRSVHQRLRNSVFFLV